MSEVTEQTLVLIKPDAVARGLTGEILSRYQAKGLQVLELKQQLVDAEMAAQHYAEHVGREYYGPLEAFITSGPLVAMVLAGRSAIEVVRGLNGATDSAKAAPGTIRGDLALSNRENLVHASDSPDNAAREIALWFPERA